MRHTIPPRSPPPVFFPQTTAPITRLHRCAPGYCCAHGLCELDACSGHRTGRLCGACRSGYTETLGGAACRARAACGALWRDTLYWVAVPVSALVLAAYLVYKPPLLQFMRAWAVGKFPVDEAHDAGYFLIMTHFYQVMGLLQVCQRSGPQGSTWVPAPCQHSFAQAVALGVGVREGDVCVCVCVRACPASQCTTP